MKNKEQILTDMIYDMFSIRVTDENKDKSLFSFGCSARHLLLLVTALEETFSFSITEDIVVNEPLDTFNGLLKMIETLSNE